MNYIIVPVVKQNTTPVSGYGIMILGSVDNNQDVKKMVADVAGIPLLFSTEPLAQAYIDANLGLIDITQALDIFDSNGEQPGLDAFFAAVTAPDLVKALTYETDIYITDRINILITNFAAADAFRVALNELNGYTPAP